MKPDIQLIDQYLTQTLDKIQPKNESDDNDQMNNNE